MDLNESEGVWTGIDLPVAILFVLFNHGETRELSIVELMDFFFLKDRSQIEFALAFLSERQFTRESSDILELTELGEDFLRWQPRPRRTDEPDSPALVPS